MGQISKFVSEIKVTENSLFFTVVKSLDVAPEHTHTHTSYLLP